MSSTETVSEAYMLLVDLALKRGLTCRDSVIAAGEAANEDPLCAALRAAGATVPA